MNYIKIYFEELVKLLLDMAPWLLTGFFIAGLLHVFFPDGKINTLLGKANMKSVLRAALIGIPLPLCSCGVIPTGVSIHKNGASKGAAISFLISTPQTGVDSIMVTYSLLGLPFAVIRPVVAFLTGIMGGFFTNKFHPENAEKPTMTGNTKKSKKFRYSVLEVFKYAFIDFMQDIAKWLVIGLLLAALLAVFIPDDFFTSYIQNDLLGMLIILAASIPVYVCATSSVPIAAVLMLKGISPGAALVFLMAGPATNAATISVIGNSMGKKTLFIYLSSLITGALISGLFIDYVLPRSWFISSESGDLHTHGLLPNWIHILSGILTFILIVNIFIKYLIRKFKTRNKITENNMGDIKIFVKGMDCNHCKMNVENNLSQLPGIDKIAVNIDTQEVILTGDKINLDEVKKTVESIGYKYEKPA